MWDLPGPGLEPVSSAMAGGFLTTALPGKPSYSYLGYFYEFSSVPHCPIYVMEGIFFVFMDALNVGISGSWEPG